MIGLLRESLKLVRDYFRDPEYRQWLRVKAICRRKGTAPLEIKLGNYTVKGNNAAMFLHQYEDVFRNRAYDFLPAGNSPLIYCCGANIGLELIYFKFNYLDCRIKAFEADPEIAQLLRSNAQSNQLKNVETISAAVWTENTAIAFAADGALGGKTGSGDSTVTAVRLADYLKNEKQIDLLIMDIEGAEMAVLTDCQSELSKINHLFVEWHGSANEKQELDRLLVLLSTAGFRYRLYTKPPISPFRNRIIENGFDSMVEIYASRS
jgi:FkbM family methyltransferase